jgi:hypothetical protein
LATSLWRCIMRKKSTPRQEDARDNDLSFIV